MNRRSSRGATAVTVALLLVALGGFLALGLNVGHFMTARGQLQNAADAGALAGAASLNGTIDGLPEARTMAEDFAERHMTDRLAIDVGLNAGNAPGGDVVLGRWDFSLPKEDAFIPLADPAATPRQVNAVLVRDGREAARGNGLEVYFSAFLSQSEASVTSEAVAVGGGACTDCAVPIVFADCIILNPDDSLACGTELVFSSATIDNIGFTSLIPGERSVNVPNIISALDSDCAEGVGVGDQIGVGNGNNLNNRVLNAFEDLIARHGPRVTAPIVSPPTCPDPQFNQLQEVVGFATFTILEVSSHPRMIRIALDCSPDLETPAAAGCGFYGTPGQVRLVR